METILNRFHLTILLIYFFSSPGFAQQFEKVDDSNVGDAKIKKTNKFINQYFELHKKGSFYEFNDEATDLVKTLFTPEMQKAVQQQINSQFGLFQSSKYVESWASKDSNNLTVLRFKGKFDKSNKDLELRVAYDKSDKIAGFWIIPWSDMFSLR